ncbi:MAG: peptidylprolyl isomerase [Clostridia bacterium]|nr:peptidylprolyl isomerase [Clostridia bacterium]MBP3369345.1 peptidylprolyl isomerase [Clostridia bacterium]
MKKAFIRVLALMLVLAIAFTAFSACSSKGKTFMKIEDTEMSVNMFQLFLSRMKGTICSSYGEEALDDSFWDTVMSADGATYNDHFTSQVLENTKTYLAALHLFEQEGLELPESYIEEIDEQIDELIENDADGSKNTFNSILSDFGVNYKMLREAYIIEAKIAYLNDYLYGSDGSKISPVLLEEYYQNNYARFKQVFIYTYALVYDTDADGNDIWYSITNPKKISYDTTATPKKDGNDNIVKDANGDTVYVDEEGKIAYDKKNGKRNPKLGSNGYQLTRDYTTEELRAAIDRAQLIAEQCVEGNYTLFDSLVDKYSEDEGMSEYPGGYYLTAESDYDSPEVVKALFEMKEGEIRTVNSDYGIHVVMKYELDEGGYADKDNSDFFVSTKTGQYVFISKLREELLAQTLKPYIDKIEIDETLIEEVDIKSVGANFYY